MPTTVENILQDIIHLLVKLYNTFKSVFTQSYRDLTHESKKEKSQFLSPRLYIAICITVFYAFTIGIINLPWYGSAILVNSYFTSIRQYSLIEYLFYSMPTWLCFLLVINLISLLIKKESRYRFINFSSYLIGTFLVIYVILGFFLSLLLNLEWEILPYAPFNLSNEETIIFMKPMSDFFRNRNPVVAVTLMLVFLYKILNLLSEQKKKNYALLLYPFYSFLLLYSILEFMKIESYAIYKYFPRNDIQITQFNRPDEICFNLNLIIPDSVYSMESALCITNKSEDNLILNQNKSSLFYVTEFPSNSLSMLTDVLNNQNFIFKCSEPEDSSMFILKSGETKVISFVTFLDKNHGDWLIDQFNQSHTRKEFYFSINFKSTNKFFSAPFFVRKMTLITRKITT